MSSLDVHLEVESSTGVLTAEYCADLKVCDTGLRDIENWVFFPADGVTGVTVGGLPIEVRKGLPLPCSRMGSSVSLRLGRAASGLKPGSFTSLMPELEKLHVVKASVPGKSAGGKGPVGLDEVVATILDLAERGSLPVGSIVGGLTDTLNTSIRTVVSYATTSGAGFGSGFSGGGGGRAAFLNSLNALPRA